MIWNVVPFRYAGRVPSASPATGNKFQHYAEQKQLMVDSLNLKKLGGVRTETPKV